MSTRKVIATRPSGLNEIEEMRLPSKIEATARVPPQNGQGRLVKFLNGQSTGPSKTNEVFPAITRPRSATKITSAIRVTTPRFMSLAKIFIFFLTESRTGSEG